MVKHVYRCGFSLLSIMNEVAVIVFWLAINTSALGERADEVLIWRYSDSYVSSGAIAVLSSPIEPAWNDYCKFPIDFYIHNYIN